MSAPMVWGSRHWELRRSGQLVTLSLTEAGKRTEASIRCGSVPRAKQIMHEAAFHFGEATPQLVLERARERLICAVRARRKAVRGAAFGVAK